MDTRPYLGAIDFVASQMNRYDLDALLGVFNTPELMPFVYRRIGDVLEKAFSSAELTAERLNALELDDEFYRVTEGQLRELGEGNRSKYHAQCLRVKNFYENHRRWWNLFFKLPIIGKRAQPALEHMAKVSFSYESQRSIAAKLADIVKTIPYRKDLIERQAVYTEREEVAEFVLSPGFNGPQTSTPIV